MAVKKKRVTFKFKFIILMVCLVYAGFLFFSQNSILNGLNKEKTELEAKLANQRVLNAQLQNEAGYMDSDSYIEKIAREKLGWVKEDETKFIEKNQ